MKKILEFFKKPPVWLIIITFVLTICFGTTAIVLACLGIDGIFTYVSYGLAGAFLAYSVYIIVRLAPHMKEIVINIINRFSFSKKIVSERDFRAVVTSTVSLALNIAYAIFNIVVAILAGSLWYGAIAIYHSFLIIMRTDTLLSRKGKMRASYIRTSVLLILLSGFLGLAVWQLVAKDLAFVRFGWTIYAYAAFAFYKITMSIISLVKSRKNTYTTRALKSVSLADALVSILTLQTSLLYAFSGLELNKVVPNLITGISVCLLTLALGIIMLIFSKKRSPLQKKEINFNERK